MLPIYLSYFAGGAHQSEESKMSAKDRASARGGTSAKNVTPETANNTSRAGKRVIFNALGFVTGFTVVFVLLGAFAGTIGWLLMEYSTLVNIITGLVVVLFGLNYLGVVRVSIGFMNKFQGLKSQIIKSQGLRSQGLNISPINFPSAFLFGLVFSIGWTPCVGAFLGTALLRAAQAGVVWEGMFMLFVFSMGLGIPFIASALLINQLKDAFTFIKRHYRIINTASGMLLVVVGLLMMTGVFGMFVSLFV